jgi:chromosome segregation ATPase
MFLYELQREEEKEKLFQQQIFQLARHEADATTQASRINAIEGRLTQAEKHQRQLQQLKPEIVANTANVAAQQEQLGACPARLVVVEEALGKIQAQLTALKETQDEQARAASAAAASPPVAPSSPTANKLDVVKQEIDVLFSDRTGILRMIDNLKESLDALNTKLDSVMVQKKNNPSPSPNLQRVRLTTNDGGLVDLGVPKGMSYISTNGGRHVEPGSIKSFSPGKQWAT